MTASTLDPGQALPDVPAQRTFGDGVARRPGLSVPELEPPVFAQGGGAGLLRSSGITVVEVPELAAGARAANAAVLGG